MVLRSDINIDTTALRPGAVSEATQGFNAQLQKISATLPKWWDVGPARYREMRMNGETAMPKPIILDGEDFEVPSRESGRSIPCRIMKPSDGVVKGVFMHLHGGGWVLMSEKT